MDDTDSQRAQVLRKIQPFSDKCEELISQYQQAHETEQFENRNHNFKLYLLVMGLLILVSVMVMVLSCLSIAIIEVSGGSDMRYFDDVVIYKGIPTTGMLSSDYFSPGMLSAPTGIAVLFIILSQILLMVGLLCAIVITWVLCAIAYVRHHNRKATFTIAREINFQLLRYKILLTDCKDQHSLDSIITSVENLIQSQESDLFRDI